jgi:hypothetical protein
MIYKKAKKGFVYEKKRVMDAYFNSSIISICSAPRLLLMYGR